MGKVNYRIGGIGHRVVLLVWGGAVWLTSLVGRLTPRNPRLWVFGNFKGFQDNPRYLFEFVSQARPDIRCIWLAADRQAVDLVRSLGYDAVRISSARGIRMAFRAGVAFIAHGLRDVNRAAAPGSLLVHLWHGSALKKVLLDTPAWDRVSKFMLRNALRHVDLVTAPGPIMADRLSSALGVARSKVEITGYARTDILLANARSKGRAEKLRELLGGDSIPSFSRAILFAPTWRFPGYEVDILVGFEATWWSTFLESDDAVLLFKPHSFMADETLNQFQALTRAVRVSPTQDINLLLPLVDALITDFSGVVFDFALLDRPIALMCPDHDRLSAELLYEDLRDLGGSCLFRSWNDLRAWVANLGRGTSAELSLAARLADPSYTLCRDTGNRQRILDVVTSRVASRYSETTLRGVRP